MSQPKQNDYDPTITAPVDLYNTFNMKRTSKQTVNGNGWENVPTPLSHSHKHD